MKHLLNDSVEGTSRAGREAAKGAAKKIETTGETPEEGSIWSNGATKEGHGRRDESTP